MYLSLKVGNYLLLYKYESEEKRKNSGVLAPPLPPTLAGGKKKAQIVDMPLSRGQIVTESFVLGLLQVLLLFLL